jgi:hypothetical protein
MAATIIDDLIPYIVPDVPGATENIIKNRMREALREFCMDTEAWTETVTMDQVDGQTSYNIALTNDAYIQRILWIKSKTSDTQNFDDILTPIGLDRYYLAEDGESIEFYNNKELKHDITDGVQFKFALRPSFQIEELSGDLFDRYGEGIFNLTKYKLMMTPNTPYTNPELAMNCYNQYQNTRVTAIREKTTENKNQGMQVQQLGGIL